LLAQFSSWTTVASYAIDATTHALTPAATGPTQHAAGFATLHPSGDFYYVACNTSDDIAALAVNTSTGALTPIDADLGTAGVQNFAAGDNPVQLAVHPSGKYLYAANNLAGTVSAYVIGANGALALIDADAGSAGHQDFAVGSAPWQLVFSAKGDVLYVLSAGAATITLFDVSAATGKLTQRAGAPVSVVNLSAIAFALAPSGNTGYLTGYNNDGVYLFDVDGTGALSLRSPTKVPSGSRPRAPLAFMPGTAYAYLSAVTGNNVTGFSVASDGSLTQLDSSPYVANAGSNYMAVHPDGKALYVSATSAAKIDAYEAQGDGALVPVIGGALTTTMSSPGYLFVTP
jgi:6-phosphogluconolactonase (cycloisomerase 2 family)